MDSKKWIVIGVLGLLIVAVAAMRNSETPAPPAAPTTETAAHSEGDGHNHTEGDGHDHSADNATTPSTPAAGTTVKGNVTKLQKTDLKVGTGKTAKTGDNVTVHYRGTLTDGDVFDESYKRGEPFPVTLGAGDVIKGWDEGIPGMKEGGKRKLVIPPDMGYGARGAGSAIPPNATLVFEVELLKVG